MSSWSLETAKARLSEVVRRARAEGPQTITVRGADAAVVLSPEAYSRLCGRGGGGAWVERLRADFIGDIELERDSDRGRDLDL